MIRFDSLAGKIIRLPLRLIPGNANVRVRSGLNKGLRWRVGSATHGCWLGHYEAEIQGRLPEFVHPGMVCYDLGANAGFYTLALARLAGATGRVLAFEPLAENAAYLLHHLAINDLPQASLVQAAVADTDGVASFQAHSSRSMGSLTTGAASNYLVPTVRLDTMLDRHGLPVPGFIKIDVERAELAALQGAESTLAQHQPALLIAFHGEHIYHGCLALLVRHHYQFQDLAGRSIAIGDKPINEVFATPSEPSSRPH